MKRSPNRRVLPDEYSPEREAGLWAADEPQAVKKATPGSLKVSVLGVEMPSPQESSTAETRVCGDFVAKAVVAAGVADVADSLAGKDRVCFAARVFAECLAQRGRKQQKRIAAGAAPPDSLRAHQLAFDVAQRFVERACDGVTEPDEVKDARDFVSESLTSLVNPRNWRFVE